MNIWIKGGITGIALQNLVYHLIYSDLIVSVLYISLFLTREDFIFLYMNSLLKQAVKDYELPNGYSISIILD